jgi:hypothetical protein
MCDLLVALPDATADGHTIFAKNSDRPPGEVQVVERHEPRVEAMTACTYVSVPGLAGPTIGFRASRPAWMWGVEHGVNDAGVACGNATVYTELDPRGFPPALTGMDLVRLVLERAVTAEDGVSVLVDLLESVGQGGSGHEGADRPYWSAFLLADPVAAWLVETSGQAWAAVEVERSAALSNRTTLLPGHPRQPVDRLVDPRLAVTRACLAAEPVTVEAVERALRSHDAVEPGWSVCMHVEGVEETTAAMIATLPVGAPPAARFVLGSPCGSAFGD